MLGCGAGASAGCMDRGELWEKELGSDSARHDPIQYELRAKKGFFANVIEMQGNEVSSYRSDAVSRLEGGEGLLKESESEGDPGLYVRGW
jgi:hypothetical protein